MRSLLTNGSGIDAYYTAIAYQWLLLWLQNFGCIANMPYYLQ
jgi:hypothetical protein